MRTHIPFWATFLTIIGVLILCSLGTWQLYRLQWKQDILTQLDKAYSTEDNQVLDLDTITPCSAYVFGRIEGIFLPDKALLMGPKPRDDKIGHDLIVPVQVNQQHTLLVNMGWTEYDLKELPIYHLNGQKVWFEGLVQTPVWNSFTPENNPQTNEWYRLDIPQIAAEKGLQNPYPFILRAERASHKFDAAFPNNARLEPNNNHLQYAIFWFTMALALIVVYSLRFIVKKRGN